MKSVIMDASLIIEVSRLEGDGHRCWGDKDPNNEHRIVAGPPQYAFLDTRRRFVKVAGPPNSDYPYDIPPLIGYRFPRPVDRFAIYLAEQLSTDNNSDPTPPGIRLMIRAGCGNYQSRIWQGDFLQPVYACPVNGSGNSNQQRGRLIEICGPMADQWEVYALSIEGSGAPPRVAAQQEVQLRIFAMVACTCQYHFQPGPYVTQTFPTP